MRDKITPRSQDYSEWYTDVIRQAELADYAPVRGCQVLRPYGYALWENVKEELDRRFKETGHENAYFPLFVPMSFIEKETQHVEGFSPELAVVTHGGGKELDEPLAVRPTSETIIGHMYSQWVRSYRDLPVLINQWSSVVRWELRTRLFLRTTEFLWQEGHTAHATAEEAQEETLQMLDVYSDFALNDAAVSVVTGRKSESEKFPGADASYSIEAMMGDRRALQSGTSHYFGQNFAKAFDITYQDENGKVQHCWTTSWGMSWRILGAIIMTHGDDQGLILPPRLAPIQVVVIPIYKKDAEKSAVLGAVEKIETVLEDSVRLKIDDRNEYSPGWKFNEWELKGVPLRIEIGPRDVAKGQVVLARRDQPGRDGKSFIPLAGLAHAVTEALTHIQSGLLRRATEFREANTSEPIDYDSFREAVAHGFARAWWCGKAECEEKTKADTQATTRCIPFDQPEGSGQCVVCGNPANEVSVFARAY